MDADPLTSGRGETIPLACDDLMSGRGSCSTSCAAGGVLDDHAVSHADDPLGVLGDVVFVGHHDDGLARLVEAFEHLHDLGRGHAVEVTGGLVGQDDVGVVDQAAGDRHALLLTAGELVGTMVEPLG